jgi:hypothetical protein
MAESIKRYVEDLFRYLDIYENRYSEFETEAFFQTYNGIYAVFQAMREQRDKAVDVDQFFLERIRQSPLSSSDLRQLTIQVLITYFESEADTDGQSNKSYLHCRELRPVKRDASYFDDHLIPLLFREGSLNNNFRLNSFFLNEIARYVNKFAKGIDADISPELYASLSDPLKMLELMRRRLRLGVDLLGDRNALEFHLQRVDDFRKLSGRGRVYEAYLKDWNYLAKSTFWDRMKSSMGVLWGKFKGLFSSFRYFRLNLVERKPAYILYTLIIIIFILLAIYIPSKWQGYAGDKLKNLDDKAIKTQQDISK